MILFKRYCKETFSYVSNNTENEYGSVLTNVVHYKVLNMSRSRRLKVIVMSFPSNLHDSLNILEV